MSFHQLISFGKSPLDEEPIFVASAPIFFRSKARAQVAKSSAALMTLLTLMSHISSKEEETALLLPSLSLVAKTVTAIYSIDQKNMHFFYENIVFMKDF